LDSPEPTKLVTAKEAREVEPVVPEPDKLALKEVENSHAQATHRAEQGWVGKICGSRGEKSGNIAFLVIVACFLLIGIALNSSGLTEPFFKLLASLLGVIGLALGYLFGAHNSKN
jgi:hypothetical protein